MKIFPIHHWYSLSVFLHSLHSCRYSFHFHHSSLFALKAQKTLLLYPRVCLETVRPSFESANWYLSLGQERSKFGGFSSQSSPRCHRSNSSLQHSSYRKWASALFIAKMAMLNSQTAAPSFASKMRFTCLSEKHFLKCYLYLIHSNSISSELGNAY